METSQHSLSGIAELNQIQWRVQNARSVDDLRLQFERLKALRQTYSDDFDTLVRISEVQNEAVDRARELRESDRVDPAAARPGARPESRQSLAPPEAVEIPPEVQRLDPQSWQRAIYIGLFFAVILFAAFFYVIQTARKLNLVPAETTAEQPAGNGETAAKNQARPGADSTPPVPAQNKPALRLYTDLIPGTVTIDDHPAQDLKDGELLLDDLQPGHHSIQVTGTNASAAFSFEVREGQAPRLIGLPAASNVMAVLVSTQDGKAQLVTNADQADVSMDGAPAGQARSDGLVLENLGKADHLLQITEGKDRQRFVLSYTPAPSLTVYVKSDPNAGTVVISTKEEGAEIYINGKLYRRRSLAGQTRIPLKVGEYMIRVHKPGFIDPPPATVSVKKAEETAVNFRLDPVPQTATLQVKGALPGTMVFVDQEFAASIGPDGNATLSNIKPGEHSIELRRDQALPKRFERTFGTGDVVLLSGPDVTLQKDVVENSTPAPNAAPPAQAPDTQASANSSMELEGQQLRKGGGFVPYHVPRVAGRYSFAGQALKSGLLHRGKLQWYAGYKDAENYILYSVDGKHVVVREVRDGESKEIGRVPFEFDSNSWVQVDLVVNHSSINVHVKTPETPWQEVGTVTSDGRDFTQEKVGFYIPDKDEIAVANFKFSAH